MSLCYPFVWPFLAIDGIFGYVQPSLSTPIFPFRRLACKRSPYLLLLWGILWVVYFQKPFYWCTCGCFMFHSGQRPWCLLRPSPSLEHRFWMLNSGCWNLDIIYLFYCKKPKPKTKLNNNSEWAAITWGLRGPFLSQVDLHKFVERVCRVGRKTTDINFSLIDYCFWCILGRHFCLNN